MVRRVYEYANGLLFLCPRARAPVSDIVALPSGKSSQEDKEEAFDEGEQKKKSTQDRQQPYGVLTAED
jgi:hypothetical protein